MNFAKSYNATPSVLLTANHSTTESGNVAPVHNGITAWIEVSSELQNTQVHDQDVSYGTDINHIATVRNLRQSHFKLRSLVAKCDITSDFRCKLQINVPY